MGDAIRVTANGKTIDGRHKLNNGSLYQVKGFDRKGNIILANDWVVAKDFGHLTHGYVTTSHAAQGKTVERVLIAMGRESAPAINAQQFYVSVTRGSESARIFTGMASRRISSVDPALGSQEIGDRVYGACETASEGEEQRQVA